MIRCGEPNFGHPYLHLVDRAQRRIQEFFDVTVWPKHKNLLDFKPTDFVAVGIGPVSFYPDNVDKGPSMAGSSKDLTYMAERMNIAVPPLPPSTKAEFQLFTHLIKDNPKPANTNFHEMAKDYKRRTNGKDKSSHGKERQPR